MFFCLSMSKSFCSKKSDVPSWMRMMSRMMRTSRTRNNNRGKREEEEEEEE